MRRIIALTCSVAMIFLLAVNVPAVHAEIVEQEQESQLVTEGIAPAATPRSITHNLFYSAYSEDNVYCNGSYLGDDPITGDYYTAYKDDGLQLRANCYGYAFRFFLRDQTIPYDETTSYNVSYKQMPGEFAGKSSGLDIFDDNDDCMDTIFNRRELDLLYRGVIFNTAYTESERLSVFLQLMRGDARILGYTLTPCSASSVSTSTSSSSRRLIAVVLAETDFHFYMQHSDGTWSHKPGGQPTSNCCLCCQNVVLTNSNIASHAAGGQYAGGIVAFYYITKSVVMDCAHSNGKAHSATKTVILNSDGAGNDFYTAKNLGTVSQASASGYIDYNRDVDFYCFSPSVNGSYELTSSAFTQSGTSTTYIPIPLTVSVYDSNGLLIASQSGAYGSVTLTNSFSSALVYYIKAETSGQTRHDVDRCYNLHIN